MKIRLLAMALTLIFALSVFSSCAREKNDKTDAENGGYKTTERIDGGINIADANAASLTFGFENDVYSLCFAFTVGSRINGTEDEVKSVAIPEYSVYALGNPTRLVVEFPSLSYWDYLHSANLSDSPLIYGSFKHSVVNLNTSYIFFQMKNFIQYKVREDGDKLYIDFIKQKNDSDENDFRYFYTANAYNEYCANIVSREIPMMPTLSRDDGQIILISDAFSSESEARSAMAETLNNNQALSEEACEIVALYMNEIPIYNDRLGNSRINEVKAARIGGLEKKLDVLIADGIYLSSSPEGFIFSKRLNSAAWENAEYDYQEIWLSKKNGGRERLLRFEFATIERAEYSADRRKLAVLENDTTGSHLYVFNMDTKELIADLADSGFGKRISAFTFDDIGFSLYAVSGTGKMNINRYDFTVLDETKRFSLVYDGEVDEGSLEYSNGFLYFSATDENGSAIYEIKPEGGIKKAFATGTLFKMSEDGKFMAVSTASGISASGSGNVLKIISTKDKTETIVTESFDVYDFIWADGELLYFENKLSGGIGESENDGSTTESTEPDKYPYTLFSYSLIAASSREICDLMYTTLNISKNENEVYIPYYDQETVGEISRGTFILKTK
ncbi:MAG: hypothetical protein RRY79_00525 [Clostridia bacterium]